MAELEQFPFPEKEVAERLGVTRELLKECRDRECTRGLDYELVGNQIQLSEKGMAVVTAFIGLAKSEKDAPPLLGPPADIATADEADGQLALPTGPALAAAPLLGPAKPPWWKFWGSNGATQLPATAGGTLETCQDAIVGTVRSKCRNTKIVMVDLDGQIVRLKVRDSYNFLKGMEVPLRLIQEPDLYELTRKAPRGLGRW